MIYNQIILSKVTGITRERRKGKRAVSYRIQTQKVADSAYCLVPRVYLGQFDDACINF